MPFSLLSLRSFIHALGPFPLPRDQMKSCEDDIYTSIAAIVGVAIRAALSGRNPRFPSFRNSFPSIPQHLPLYDFSTSKSVVTPTCLIIPSPSSSLLHPHLPRHLHFHLLSPSSADCALRKLPQLPSTLHVVGRRPAYFLCSRI